VTLNSVIESNTAVGAVSCIGLCMVLRPRQHSIGYMGDGFYRSKDPTHSIKVLKEKATNENNQTTQRKHKIHICIHIQNSRQIKDTHIKTQQVH